MASARVSVQPGAESPVGSTRNDLDRSYPHASRGYLKRLFALIPRPSTGQPLPPVDYTVPLVATVALLVALAAGLFVLSVHAPRDYGSLAAIALLAFAAGFYAVKVVGGVSTPWSVAVFLHLGVAYAIGPAGSLVVAVGDAAGIASLRKPGWFRSTFNVANNLLSDLGAWAVFSVATSRTGNPWLLSGAATVGGAVDYAINYGLLLVVTYLSQPPGHEFVWADWVKNFSRAIFHVVYGLAAYSVVLAYDRGGVVGLITSMAAGVLLQGFLVYLAYRTLAYQAAEEARQAERLEEERIKRELSERALRASAQERVRIAADLHDGPVQDLFGMCGEMEALLHTANSTQDDYRRLTEQFSGLTRQVLLDLRAEMTEIAPPKLLTHGLKDALEELRVRLDKKTIAFAVECPPDLPLSETKRQLIYRIAQEGIRNIAKHARCTHVELTIAEGNDGVTVSLVDNGQGFSTREWEQRQGEGHVGLTYLIETARDGGATLTIDSAPGEGTKLVMQIPTDEEDEPASPSELHQ